jgi:hypothetical protein
MMWLCSGAPIQPAAKADQTQRPMKKGPLPMLTMKSIRQRLSTSAVLTALVLGVATALVGGQASSAHAEPKTPVDNGVRCAIQTGPGSYDFYLPGETVIWVDAQGRWHYYQCMNDGEWFEAGGQALRAGTTLRATPSVVTRTR